MQKTAMLALAVVCLSCLMPSLMAQVPLPHKFDGTQLLPDPNRLLDPAAFTDCSGWLEPRVYMETQSWFAEPDKNVDTESTHLHIGGCLPHTQYVAGVIPLDLLVQKHQMPAQNINATVGVEVFFQWSGGNTTIRLTQSRNLNNFTCNAQTQVCKQVISAWVETANIKYKIPDGVNRMSIKSKVSFFDGISTRSMSAELLSWVIVANGNPGTITQKAWPITQNSLNSFPWSYVHSSFDGAATFNPIVPITNATHPLILKIHHVSDATIANVTRLFTTRNPKFHTDPLYPTLGDLGAIPYIKDYNITVRPFMNATLPDNKLNGCTTSRNHTNCYTTYNISTHQWPDNRYNIFIRTDSFHPMDEPVLKAFNDNKTAAGGVGVNGGTVSAVSLFVLSVNTTGTLEPFKLGDPTPGGISYPPPIAPPQEAWYFAVNSTHPAGVINPHRADYTGGNLLPDWSNMLQDDYYTCKGWDAVGLKMRYLEAQAWFTKPLDTLTNTLTADMNASTVEADLVNQSQHLHVGACMPHGQLVAGHVPLDIVVNKHLLGAQQNVTVSIKVEFEWSGGNTTFRLTQNSNLGGWACSSQMDCRKVLPVWIATQNSQWVIPNGLHKMRVEAAFSLNDGISNRGFSARIESWIKIANNPIPAITTKMPVSSTAKTDFPWSYTHANLVDDPYATDVVSGDMNFVSKHFIETSVSNITSVFNTVNPKFHKEGATVEVMKGAVFNEFQAVSRIGTSCSKTSGGKVDCNNVQNSIKTVLDGSYQRVFLRTDSFVANQDPTLKAFNLNHFPGKNGGTFSAVTLYTVKVAGAPAARKLLQGQSEDRQPEFISSSLGNPTPGTPRKPVDYEVESQNGQGTKPIKGSNANTNRVWTKGEVIPWAQSIGGGDYVGSSTRPTKSTKY